MRKVHSPSCNARREKERRRDSLFNAQYLTLSDIVAKLKRKAVCEMPGRQSKTPSCAHSSVKVHEVEAAQVEDSFGKKMRARRGRCFYNVKWQLIFVSYIYKVAQFGWRLICKSCSGANLIIFSSQPSAHSAPNTFSFKYLAAGILDKNLYIKFYWQINWYFALIKILIRNFVMIGKSLSLEF